MKQFVAASLIACSGALTSSQATVLFSDTFNSYTAGNLVGQGPWLQTSTSAVTPVQVTGGAAVLGTSGQDVYAALPGGIYTIPDGSTFNIGLDLTVSSAQATGDYFLHTTPTAGNASTFVERLEIKSSGSGFVIGYLETAGGTGAVVNYGSTVLNLNTDYRVVVVYNAIAGTLNDTASVYVNPTDTTTEANNTAYIANDAWGSTSPETDAVAALNLRQGSATAAPGLTVDNLNAGTAFGDVATFNPVLTPEPSSMALLGMGGVAGAFFFRRRNRK